MPQMCLEPRTNTNQPQVEWVRTVRNWHLFKSDKVAINSEWSWMTFAGRWILILLTETPRKCFKQHGTKKNIWTSGTATESKWDPNSSLLSCCKLIPFRSTGGAVGRIIPNESTFTIPVSDPMNSSWCHVGFTGGIPMDPIRWLYSCTPPWIPKRFAIC